MTLGTLLTLFVVPTVYTYIARKKPFAEEDTGTRLTRIRRSNSLEGRSKPNTVQFISIKIWFS